MNCIYEKEDTSSDGRQKYKCVTCGHERTSKYPATMLHRRCEKQPSSIGMAARFVTAAVLHVARGSPKRTEDEIAILYAICVECERFDRDVCSLCGCRLKRKLTYRNKLAWADQHCDEGKW